MIKFSFQKSNPKRTRGRKCPASCQLGLKRKRNENEKDYLVWKIRNRKNLALANAVSFSRMFTKARPTMGPKPLWRRI